MRRKPLRQGRNVRAKRPQHTVQLAASTLVPLPPSSRISRSHSRTRSWAMLGRPSASARRLLTCRKLVSRACSEASADFAAARAASRAPRTGQRFFGPHVSANGPKPATTTEETQQSSDNHSMPPAFGILQRPLPSPYRPAGYSCLACYAAVSTMTPPALTL